MIPIRSWYPREDKHQIEFLDFFVDGQPLRELLSVPAEMAKPEQETTALRDYWPHAAVEQLDRLMSLIPGDFSDGRVSLLICPVCGDQACADHETDNNGGHGHLAPVWVAGWHNR